MNLLANNQINQINMQNNMLNQIMQANYMSNCQAEYMRMNYYSNLNNFNSNLYSPGIVIPKTDNSIVEDLEKFFSVKHLNRDLNLRKNMDQETGNVPIEFILNLNKIKSINLNEDIICKMIEKVGSDIIEIIKVKDKLYLRPKKFDEIKDKLKSIEEIEKENSEKVDQKKQQQNQQNMAMNMQPMAFYPKQPFMYYAPMMMLPQTQPQTGQNPPGFVFPVQNNINNDNKNN